MERQLDPRAIGDHIDRLHRAAWALCGSREDAEDLVQETFARVLAKPRLLRREDDLAYLLRAMRNVFLTQRRTESRRPRTSPLPEEAVLAERRPDADPEAVLRDARGLRRRRRPARRLPRRAGGRGRRRPLVQGGREGPEDARGHRDEPPLPRAPAGGPGAGRGRALRRWRRRRRAERMALDAPEPRRPRRGTAIALGAVVALGAAVAPAAADLIDRSSAAGRLVLIGQDADSTTDPVIQPPTVPPAPRVGDQSLRKADQLLGGSNDDVLDRPPRPRPADRQRRRRRDRRRPGARRRHRRRRVPQLRRRLRRPGRRRLHLGARRRQRRLRRRRAAAVHHRDRHARRAAQRPPRARHDRTGGCARRPTTTSSSSAPRRSSPPTPASPAVPLAVRPPAARWTSPGALGTAVPQGAIKGFCEVVPAPAGLGYQFLVRFSGRAFRVLQVTMRVEGRRARALPHRRRRRRRSPRRGSGRRAAGRSPPTSATFRPARRTARWPRSSS